ncbi:MAG: cupin domain-containing protein [Marinifilum sp.]|jgi:quercetin dioxygenase-like cupin family protein|nr:cupin domain-containing protein [Marinifilum sp.]
MNKLLKKLSNKIEVSKIRKEQIYSNSQFENLLVSVEKGMEVPPQPAPANASLYLIQGKLTFDIEGVIHIVEEDDFFSFEKGQMHGLKAEEDSKFLISRILLEK